MTFHVVPISRERAHQLPVIESLLLDIVEKAMVLKPVILICDSLQGQIAGYESYFKILFLNAVALDLCRHLGLEPIGAVEQNQIPSPYILLVGPAFAADQRDELD